MAIYRDGKKYDTMSEAAERLQISRSTIINYLRADIFPKPPRLRRGKQSIRAFTEEWYREAEEIMKSFH